MLGSVKSFSKTHTQRATPTTGKRETKTGIHTILHVYLTLRQDNGNKKETYFVESKSRDKKNVLLRQAEN